MLGANWRTTLFGAIAAVSQILSGQGVHLGHIGSTDVIGLVGSVSLLLLGLFAKDKAVTGGNVPNDIK